MGRSVVDCHFHVGCALVSAKGTSDRKVSLTSSGEGHKEGAAGSIFLSGGSFGEARVSRICENSSQHNIFHTILCVAQGKSKARAILPWLQAKSDITRDECLNALRSLRASGELETNADSVKNNCQIRWFLAGTRNQEPVADEAPAAAAK